MAVYPSSRPHHAGFILYALLFFGVLSIGITWLVRSYVLPPIPFPGETTIVVSKGDDLGTVAYRLEQQNLIKSAEAFKLFVLMLGDAQQISVGTYYFNAPLSVVEVALKITGHSFGVLQNKVTFPEGITNEAMAVRLKEAFPSFDSDTFLSLARGKQGYLFPDTYSFSPDVTPDEVIETLERTFSKKFAPLEATLAISKRTKDDIVIMASILEKEAATHEEMPVIAGILWKRIAQGIPLQVDAPLTVLLGKTSAQLTKDDLASTNPYNTYVHKGLPPGAIGNPGVAALSAALYPVDSPYLFYLHDSSGRIHYASTFEKHRENKANYLD